MEQSLFEQLELSVVGYFGLNWLESKGLVRSVREIAADAFRDGWERDSLNSQIIVTGLKVFARATNLENALNQLKQMPALRL